MYILIFLLALIALVASQVYDIALTEKGIKAGVAVEGNSIITVFFGDKPTAKQLYLHNTIIGGAFAIVALVGVFTANPGWLGVGVGPMIAYAARHIQGGLAWRKLLKK